jgi:hypothetical protein
VTETVLHARAAARAGGNDGLGNHLRLFHLLTLHGPDSRDTETHEARTREAWLRCDEGAAVVEATVDREGRGARVARQVHGVVHLTVDTEAEGLPAVHCVVRA